MDVREGSHANAEITVSLDELHQFRRVAEPLGVLLPGLLRSAGHVPADGQDVAYPGLGEGIQGAQQIIRGLGNAGQVTDDGGVLGSPQSGGRGHRTVTGGTGGPIGDRQKSRVEPAQFRDRCVKARLLLGTAGRKELKAQRRGRGVAEKLGNGRGHGDKDTRSQTT